MQQGLSHHVKDEENMFKDFLIAAISTPWLVCGLKTICETTMSEDGHNNPTGDEAEEQQVLAAKDDDFLANLRALGWCSMMRVEDYL